MNHSIMSSAVFVNPVAGLSRRLPMRRGRVCCCSLLLLVSALLLTLLASPRVAAHGSVADEGDACLIRFGFYSAHFSIFQPRTREHDEFCEDIPDVTETVFVMEYQHRSLSEVPIDFRIIRNDRFQRRFVRWEDIEALPDLEPLTVFHQSLPPQADGVLSVMHVFDEPGEYIGIVTAPHPDGRAEYQAVFPFRVGSRWQDHWPWAIAGLALVLLTARQLKRPPRGMKA